MSDSFHHDSDLSKTYTYSFFQKSSNAHLQTFWGRFNHFQKIVDPRNFLVTSQQLEQSIKLINDKRDLEKIMGQPLTLSKTEHQQLLRAISIKNSAIHPDTGEQVPRYMRMCAFVPVNVPILFGMLLSKNTITNTIFWQWFNQSFNAGLNYGNRNASSTYTNKDLAIGYSAAVGSSVSVALTLRYFFSGIASSVTGSKLILINSLISSIASGSAGFLNSFCMRGKEMENGISVFADDQLTQKIGISKVCAKKAVMETATSRIFLSIGCLVSPAVIFYIFEKLGKYPKTPMYKIPFEVAVFLFALMGSLPLSIAIFPNTGSVKVEQLEEDIQKQMKSQGLSGVGYYNKGL